MPGSGVLLGAASTIAVCTTTAAAHPLVGGFRIFGGYRGLVALHAAGEGDDVCHLSLRIRDVQILALLREPRIPLLLNLVNSRAIEYHLERPHYYFTSLRIH